ncbi:MAG: hypothetical protein ACN6O3_03490 [Comamonas sp.]
MSDKLKTKRQAPRAVFHGEAATIIWKHGVELEKSVVVATEAEMLWKGAFNRL